MVYFQTIAALAALASLSGCGLGTDAATRLAYDLKAGAKALGKAEGNELEVEHRPRSFPEGINGDYDIVLQAVRSGIPAGGTLAVAEAGGRWYGTSYHLNFVTVPEELAIHKGKGEPAYLLLRKTGVPDDGNLRGNKAVEVVSIR